MKPCGATRSLKGFEEDERGFIKSTKANDTLFELAEETCQATEYVEDKIKEVEKNEEALLAWVVKAENFTKALEAMVKRLN